MTIKEIAKLCGVSRGTVDRVLNDRGKVKPETRELVMRMLTEHGYTKNIAGRALTVRRMSPVIGVILCSEGNPFFDDVIEGLARAQTENADYGVTMRLVTMRGHEVRRQLQLIEDMEDEIAALVIQPINDPVIFEHLHMLRKQGMPVVAVNTDIAEAARSCYVGSDYERGGSVAAGMAALMTGGQANMGVIGGVDTLMGHALRLRGFEEHLRAICPQIRWIAKENAEDDPELAYARTCAMLKSHPEIDTLFIVAAGVYDVCRAVIDMGRETSLRVIAYDDVPSTREMIMRGLIRAVVCQQPHLQGYQAFNVAFNAILSGAEPKERSIIMEDQIKIRENFVEENAKRRWDS